MKRLMTLAAFTLVCATSLNAQNYKLNELEYFADRGVNLLVYSNGYTGMFCDEKLAGIEIIQRGDRIATGGGIRLMNTPEQWDIFGEMESRTVNPDDGSIELVLNYPDYDFKSKVRVTSEGAYFKLQVILDMAVPEKLVGKAGFNLEFFPATYFDKSFIMDALTGILPKYPSGETHMSPLEEKIPQFFGLSTFDDRGRNEFVVPHPLATGHNLVLAPEDDNLRVAISSNSDLKLFDGRNLAQNGTFVVRSFLPAGKTGTVLEWKITPSFDPTWVRKPNIGISQIGYTPAEKKIAVVELDKNYPNVSKAQIYRIGADGKEVLAKEVNVKDCGEFNHRYKYSQVDFSEIREAGLYRIGFGDSKSNAFPIDKGVYNGKWHSSLDVFMPVQMDHMEVNEAYRIWHGRSHMDDALQAPVGYQQMDGYSQGPVTNTKYKSLERIPNLAVGGWFDAGDFDIQTRTVVSMVADFAKLWEAYAPMRDETYIDQETKFVDIHRPDGTPDVIQQIQHGTLNINAQVENIGFVAQGIIQQHMHQYHHLGDASTITDGLPYNPNLKPYESDGLTSGTTDDRFAFTGNFSPAGTMGTVASLASAYRVLKDYYPQEAERSLKNAVMLYEKYFEDADPAKQDNTQRRWFGMGGDARISAAVELWRATGESKYKDFFEPLVLKQLEPVELSDREAGYFYGAPLTSNGTVKKAPKMYNLSTALAVYPYMDKSFQKKVEAVIPEYAESHKDSPSAQNPYGVPISGNTWGGNDQVISWALKNYELWKLFPDQVDPESVLQGLRYLYGTHPYSNKSFVTAVGINTKHVSYGNTRADYTVVPGGVVPGLLLLNPDYMENKDDYPFLWGENECCTNSTPTYLLLSMAAEEIAAKINE